MREVLAVRADDARARTGRGRGRARVRRARSTVGRGHRRRARGRRHRHRLGRAGRRRGRRVRDARCSSGTRSTSTLRRGRPTTVAGRRAPADRRCSTSCRASRGPRWRTMLVEEPRLRWVRTQVLGRAPGFAPGPPVVGPYRPITVATSPTRLSCGERTPAWSRSTARVASRRELWWPHTARRSGSTPTASRPHGREPVGRLPGPLGQRRAGLRAAARCGPRATWPRSTRRSSSGLNLVRVTGIAAYETDEFYARCDELGLLVWQDLMFATFDYPLADEEFRATVEAEVRDQLRAAAGAPLRRGGLRLAPSTSSRRRCSGSARRPGTPASWPRCCGRSSRTPASTRSGSTARRPGETRSIRVDTGIAQYFGVGAYLRDLPDARHSGVRFASECLAFSNLPDPVVAGGVPQDNGADWDFADVREHYRGERYGADATEAERAAGHRRGDGRRVRRVAAPGLRLRRRHRALAARPRARRRLGAARPRRARPSRRRSRSRRRCSRPRSGSSTRGSTGSTCTSPTTAATPSTLTAHRRAAPRGRLGGRVRRASPGRWSRTATGAGPSTRCSAGSRTRRTPTGSARRQHAGVRARLAGDGDRSRGASGGSRCADRRVTYRLAFTEDPAEFLAAAGELLAADPVRQHRRRRPSPRGRSREDAEGKPAPEHPRWWVSVPRGRRRVGRGRDADRAVRAVPALRAADARRRRAASRRRARRARRGGRAGVNGALPAAEVLADELAGGTGGGTAGSHEHTRLHVLGRAGRAAGARPAGSGRRRRPTPSCAWPGSRPSTPRRPSRPDARTPHGGRARRRGGHRRRIARQDGSGCGRTRPGRSCT